MNAQRWTRLGMAAGGLIGGLLVCSMLRGTSEPKRNIEPDRQIQPAAARPAAADSIRAGRVADSWRGLALRSRTAANEREILDYIEKLASTDPQYAILLARQETEVNRRNLLLKAALRGWGRIDPDAAAEWLLAQPRAEGHAIVAGLLEGAAAHPAKAEWVTKRMIEQDPYWEEGYGTCLVHALGNAGAFDTLAEFAVDSTSPSRLDWLGEIYQGWTGPEAAAKPGGDPLRRQAFEAVCRHWAESDPKGLAEYAFTLPDGQDRSLALTRALGQWVKSHPLDAEQWLAQRNPTADLDAGTQAVATDAGIIRQDPERALGWAGTIVDPARRKAALIAVVRQWAATDPAAARKYVESSADLDEPARKAALETIDAAATRK